MEIVSYGPDNTGLPPPAQLGPMSSDKPGEIERIQFVISNIRNPLRPGKLKGPVVGDSIKDIFGVHIYSIEMKDSTPSQSFCSSGGKDPTNCKNRGAISTLPEICARTFGVKPKPPRT